ncbi:MAG: carbohydrate-binding family 9-like protein [Planctomycetota bacterium]|nr:carbohydrate-binding family 9-like protein [Planctomycetota bacterium]
MARTRTFGCLALLTMLAAGLNAAEPAAEIKPDPKLDPKVNQGILPAEYQGLPLLWVPKLEAPEKLSGDLKHEVWKKAAAVEMGEVISGAKAKVRTEIKAFCTDDALYLGFRCEEPKMDELKKDGEIWSRDEVEMFFEPSKDTIKKCYHQIIVDADNDSWKGRCHIYPRYRYQQIREDWNGAFESATAKEAQAWTLEVKIPFGEMKMTEEAKGKKTLWRFNANRVRPGKSGGEEENMSWSPLNAKYFHSAGRFGYLLPETFATPQLVAQIKKTAGKKAPPAEPEAAAVWEVRKRIGELQAEDFSERDAATRRLRELARQDAPTAGCVFRELLNASQRSRDSQIAGAARVMLTEIKGKVDDQGEDDPPPDHIRAQGAAE